MIRVLTILLLCGFSAVAQLPNIDGSNSRSEDTSEPTDYEMPYDYRYGSFLKIGYAYTYSLNRINMDYVTDALHGRNMWGSGFNAGLGFYLTEERGFSFNVDVTLAFNAKSSGKLANSFPLLEEYYPNYNLISSEALNTTDDSEYTAENDPSAIAIYGIGYTIWRKQLSFTPTVSLATLLASPLEVNYVLKEKNTNHYYNLKYRLEDAYTVDYGFSLGLDARYQINTYLGLYAKAGYDYIWHRVELTEYWEDPYRGVSEIQSISLRKSIGYVNIQAGVMILL